MGQPGIGEHCPPAGKTGRLDGADAVPGGEAEQQHADQRDQPEDDEERERRQRQPTQRPLPSAYAEVVGDGADR